MAMRRFEFVEGKSSKFWMGGVEGNTFVAVYGRIGTNGQRKEKVCASPEEARKQLEKAIAEKLKKGYQEVDAPQTTSEAAPPPPPPKPTLPPRFEAQTPTPERVSAAIDALKALQNTLGKRSWMVSHQARRARRALEAIAGYDPSSTKAMAQTFDQLMQAVVAPKTPRLSLRLALELLSELPTSAFSRALTFWKNPPQTHAAASALALLTREAERLEDPELAFRLGTLLTEHPETTTQEAAWKKRWQALAPCLQAHLQEKGSSLKDYLKAIDTAKDPHLTQRVAKLG